MGSKLRRKWRGEKDFELEDVEIEFGQRVYLNLKITPSQRLRASLDVYKNQKSEIKIDIPGRRLNYEEIEKLNSIGCNLCGYLRKPHLFLKKITGLCALTENFELCKFPREIYSHKDNCLFLYDWEMEAIAREKKND